MEKVGQVLTSIDSISLLFLQILRIKEAVRAITTASPTTIIAESNAHLLVFDVASGNELVKLPRAKEVAPAAAIFAARVKDQVDVVTVRLDARYD